MILTIFIILISLTIKWITDNNRLLKQFTNIEKCNNINKIDDYVETINSKCNVIYSDIEVNKICDSYDTLYEKLINLYVQDLNNYNNKITSYNEYKKESIELFNQIHKDYIDYNKDNTYEGRIVENGKEE